MARNTSSMYYQKAIDILVADESNWKGVAAAMAKVNPKLFCEVVGMSPLAITAKQIWDTKDKISAIKYVRKETGKGLKEAKEYVEGLVEQ